MLSDSDLSDDEDDNESSAPSKTGMPNISSLVMLEKLNDPCFTLVLILAQGELVDDVDADPDFEISDGGRPSCESSDDMDFIDLFSLLLSSGTGISRRINRKRKASNVLLFGRL